MPLRLLHFLLSGLFSAGCTVSTGPPAMKGLTEIAARHRVPMPPEEARLVLAHTESWRVLGNSSTSRDPGIYSPAFLLGENEDGSVIILRGAERQTLKKRHHAEPLWRPFSLETVEPKLGGHVVEFNRLSAFVCAVQSADRGDTATAEGIWQRFTAAKYWSDDQSRDAIASQLKNPSRMACR